MCWFDHHVLEEINDKDQQQATDGEITLTHLPVGFIG
jgi:hypothetical protein